MGFCIFLHEDYKVILALSIEFNVSNREVHFVGYMIHALVLEETPTWRIIPLNNYGL